MKIKFFQLFIIAIIFAALTLIICCSENFSARENALDSSKLLISFSGDLSGNFKDCGCKNDQAGGLARQISIAENIAKSSNIDEILYLDVGGYCDFSSPEKTLSSSNTSKIFAKMGIYAANISKNDLANGIDWTLQNLESSGTTFISANLIYADSGKTVFPSHVIKTFGTKRIVIIGMTEENEAKVSEGNIIIEDPVSSLKTIVEDVKGSSDYIILLTRTPRRQVAAILSEISGIDLVLGNDGFSITDKIRHFAGSAISYCGSQGKHAGYLILDSGNESPAILDHSVVKLLMSIPEKPYLKSFIAKLEESE